MHPNNIVVADNGSVIELTTKHIKCETTVPAGEVFVDGGGVGEVGAVVLNDRKLLAEDGMVVIVLPMSSHDHQLLCPPEIVTRGFVYVKESEELLEDMRRVATEAVDRLHSTAESHHRVMILEVMGRYAGWIALHAGVAGGADVILIPEIPYHIEAVAEKIRQRKEKGKNFSIVVVAEGAKPEGGEMTIARIVKGSFEQIRLGGVGNKLANELEALTGIESRCTILGYLQRGGSPTAFDRVLCTRYGVAAVEACIKGEYDVMVSLHNDSIVQVSLQAAGAQPKSVLPDNEIIKAARYIGISFGDEK